jgi:hypothetical protein
VQVANMTQRVMARDSKDPAGPVLAFSLTAWAAFLGDVKRGLYDA